jgi:hypothetical protein
MVSSSLAHAWQFHSFIGVNPLQTTWLEHGIVSGRVALLLRSAEIQPAFGRFSDWTQNPITPTHNTQHHTHQRQPAARGRFRTCLFFWFCPRQFDLSFSQGCADDNYFGFKATALEQRAEATQPHGAAEHALRAAPRACSPRSTVGAGHRAPRRARQLTLAGAGSLAHGRVTWTTSWSLLRPSVTCSLRRPQGEAGASIGVDPPASLHGWMADAVRRRTTGSTGVVHKAHPCPRGLTHMH